MSKGCSSNIRQKHKKPEKLQCWEENCKNYPVGLTTSQSYSVLEPLGGEDIDAIISPVNGGSFALYPANTFRGTNAVDFRSDNPANGNIGDRTIAGGEENGLLGKNNFVTGISNDGKGDNNILSGNNNTLSDDNNIVSGQNNTVKGGPQDPPTDFQKGANFVSGYTNNVEGYVNIVSGYNNNVIYNNVNDNDIYADGNIVSGLGNTINGSINVVSGINNEIIGDASFVSGGNNKIYGDSSYINGYSNVLGDTNTFSLSQNFIMGDGLKNVKNNYSLLMGLHGESKNASTDGVLQGDFSLQIASGTTQYDTNGVKVMIGVDTIAPRKGYGYTDLWVTGGVDYAEYFQLAGPKYLTEDERIGYFVDLDNNGKAIIATSNDPIGVFGSTSGTPGVIGGAALLNWEKLYLKDKFGRRLTKKSLRDSALKIVGYEMFHKLVKDDTLDDQDLIDTLKLTKEQKDRLEYNNVPILNPAYDPNKEYIPRVTRPEWTIVSLLGQIIVRDNGLCQVGQRCSCLNGIAIPGDKWIVMERISNDTIFILFK